MRLLNSEQWMEIPEALGKALWERQEAAMSKGAQHKYVRRVPNKTPPPKWKYFYDVSGGHGLGHEEEMVVGAKFKIEGGHYEVIETSKGAVKVRHDETGEERVFKKRDFEKLLHEHHGERIKERTETLRRLVLGATLHGSEKQRARLQERAKKWSELFGGMWGLLTPDPLPEVPKGATEAYKSRKQLMEDLRSWQQMVNAMLPEPMSALPEKVPPNMRRLADRLTGQLADMYGLDPMAEDPKENFEAAKAWRKRAEYLMGERAANRAQNIARVFDTVRSIADGKWPGSGNVHFEADWEVRKASDTGAAVDVLDFDQAKEDLRLDQRLHEPTPDAAVWVAQMLGQLKRNYYGKDLGTRTGYKFARQLISQVRTHRGLDAVYRLLSSSYQGGKAIASKSAREVIGYGMSDAEKRARRTMEDLKEHGWEKARFHAARISPDLQMAIEADAKAANDKPQELKTLLGDTGRPKILKAEQQGNLLHHRWNQVPEKSSEVKKLFRKRFGVRLVLEDGAFEDFTDPTVRGYDQQSGYGRDLDISAMRWEDTKDVLARVSEEDRARAKRLLNLERHSWGLDTFQPDWDPKASPDAKRAKAAANELREAVSRSHETKRDAAAAVYNAFSDFEEVTGVSLDLSNIPVVVSDKNITPLADAHYAPALGPVSLERAELAGADVTDRDTFRKTGKLTPHIGIGTKFEKSLAHEIIHYLDNRVTLRHSEVNARLLDVQRWMESDNAQGAITEKEDPDGEIYSIVTSALNRMRWDAKGNDYLSSAAAWIAQQRSAPGKLTGLDGGWEHPAAKRVLDRVEKAVASAPGGKEMLGLMHALASTGAMARYEEKDGKSFDPLTEFIEKINGAKFSDEKKAYWSNGTEILARTMEQMIHHRLAEKGRINPTLTHLSYDGKPTNWDGPSGYVDPKEFKEKIQPHAEKVLKFLTDNMTKSLRLVIPADLCKARRRPAAPEGQMSLFGAPSPAAKPAASRPAQPAARPRQASLFGAPAPAAKPPKPSGKPPQRLAAGGPGGKGPRKPGGGGGRRGGGRGKAPPGEIREWADGFYQKQGDGTWKKIRDKETTHGGPKSEPKPAPARRADPGVLGDVGRGQGVVGRAHAEAERPAPEGAPEKTAVAAELRARGSVPKVAETALPDGRKVTIKPLDQTNPAIALHPDLWPEIEKLPPLPGHVASFPNPAELRTSDGTLTGHISQLFPHQAEGARRVLNAWEKGDGALLQDAAGLGKTLEALAAIQARGGKRNLIVVPAAGKEGLKAQWMGDRGAKLYNVDVRGARVRTTRTGREVVEFQPDDLSATEDGTYIVSYDELWETKRDEEGNIVRNEKGKIVKQLRKSLFDGRWDTIAFDESHTMQKPGGMFSNAGKALQEQAEKVLYMSATPFTNISDMHYLTKLGFFGNSEEEFAKWAELAGAKVDGKQIKNPSSHLPMAAIAATLHVNGKSIKRSTSMEGVFSQFGQMSQGSLTEEEKRAFAGADKIIAMASAAMGPEFLRAFYVGWSRQYWEICKVRQAIDIGKKALADGKQVAFFTSYKSANHRHLRSIPEMLDRRAAKMSMSDNPAVQAKANQFAQLAEDIREVIDSELPPGSSAVDQLVEAFGGGAEVAEIHGNTTKKAHAEQESYQAGQKRVVVATMSKGGTGISLHDTTGERPRVQINLSLPWSGREYLQVAGRSHRLGSKSNTEMHWLVGDDDDEMKNGAKVAKRLQSMGSLTAGDPEMTVDASELLAWEFADNGPDSDDEADLGAALMEMEADLDPERSDESRLRGAADAEHAEATRDYFREYAERIKAGGDVLKERYEEAQKRHKQLAFRESRRAAEQLREKHGLTIHWRSYLGAWEIDRASLTKKQEAEIKKKKVGGRGRAYGGKAAVAFSVPPDGMQHLSEALGASNLKVDISGAQEHIDPTKRSDVEQVIDQLGDKDLRVRFWGHSHSGQPVYLVTGRTWDQRAALGAVGRFERFGKDKADQGYLIAEDHLQVALENIGKLGDWSARMKEHPSRYGDRPRVSKPAQHKKRTHLAKGSRLMVPRDTWGRWFEGLIEKATRGPTIRVHRPGERKIRRRVEPSDEPTAAPKRTLQPPPTSKDKPPPGAGWVRTPNGWARGQGHGYEWQPLNWEASA